MFERARASEVVSASVRCLLAEGTGANAPAQPVDPPPGYRPGRRASEQAKASEFVSASARRLLTEGTGAQAPAQPVDPPHGYRPGRRAPEEANPP